MASARDKLAKIGALLRDEQILDAKSKLELHLPDCISRGCGVPQFLADVLNFLERLEQLVAPPRLAGRPRKPVSRSLEILAVYCGLRLNGFDPNSANAATGEQFELGTDSIKKAIGSARRMLRATPNKTPIRTEAAKKSPVIFYLDDNVLVDVLIQYWREVFLQSAESRG